MKKGFTLIELLIVMVVLGILVTVALPKYQASLERGRGVEGINNLKAASDAANARYVMDGNMYVEGNIANSSGDLLVGDFSKTSSFGKPQWYSGSASTAVLYISRESGDYELYAINKDGELKYMACSGLYDACLNLGAEEASFTDSYSNSNLIINFQ